MADKTFWEKTKENSKAGFDKIWEWTDKLGAPVNKLTNKLGSEAFWPTSLDKESDKAARILRSFCKDGFYADQNDIPAAGPTQKQRVIKKIPQKVIEKAVGLCIFTTMRTGLWVSGSGGSGVLVARLEDGSWSPPSGIMLHTAGIGFLAGIDIYDCVIVINNRKALEGFTNIRVTLGGELSAVAGPVGMGGVVDTELHTRQAPLFTYMKSRGLYAGVALDGTIMIERTDENEKFYGERITAANIVGGKAKSVPFDVRKLQETLKAAEGKAVDESIIPDEPAPGDYQIEGPTHVFGVPDDEDPDPFGVNALQESGLQIVEAGSRAKPPGEEFEFKPAITSPINEDEQFKHAIEAARTRRATVTSMSSPKIGSSEEPRASIETKQSLKKAEPRPDSFSAKGPPPTLPSRESVAKAPVEAGDITEVKTDAEHFDKVDTAAEEVPSTAEVLEPKIQLLDAEAPEAGDLAAEKLEKVHLDEPDDVGTAPASVVESEKGKAKETE